MCLCRICAAARGRPTTLQACCHAPLTWHQHTLPDSVIVPAFYPSTSKPFYEARVNNKGVSEGLFSSRVVIVIECTQLVWETCADFWKSYQMNETLAVLEERTVSDHHISHARTHSSLVTRYSSITLQLAML